VVEAACEPTDLIFAAEAGRTVSKLPAATFLHRAD
jgi:hypothetical protein